MIITDIQQRPYHSYFHLQFKLIPPAVGPPKYMPEYVPDAVRTAAMYVYITYEQKDGVRITLRQMCILHILSRHCMFCGYQIIYFHFQAQPFLLSLCEIYENETQDARTRQSITHLAVSMRMFGREPWSILTSWRFEIPLYHPAAGASWKWSTLHLKHICRKLGPLGHL